jgi:TldD protein
MKVPLSAHLRAVRPPLRALIERLGLDFPYASVLASDCAGMRYTVQRQGATAHESRWSERGYAVRVYVPASEAGTAGSGGAYLEHSFNELPANGLEAFAESLSEAFRLRASQNLAAQPAADPLTVEEPLAASWQGEVAILPRELGAEEKFRRLQGIKDRAAQACRELVDIRVIYEEVAVAKLFLSVRRDLAQSYVWSQGYLIPIVRRAEVTRQMVRSFSGLKGPELIDEMEAGLVATLAVAEELLGAEHIVPGEYDIILSPEAAGLLAHESFGHGVEMDMFVKGRAKAAHYVGRPVASPLVSLRDGARAAAQTGSCWFDDEGVLTGDTLVIDRGVLRGGISDLLSALRLDSLPTGNGKRESFERKAYARMTNTFFTAGECSKEELIASVQHGYLLEKFLSGMEDPKNWGVQGVILYAREIRDGQLTGKVVAPVIMTGYVPDVLGSVSKVSRELAMSGSGMCGKGHKEYLKNSAGGPYLKARMRLG